jgi:hypothetical protein
MSGLGKNYSKNNTGFRKESDFYETPYSMTQQLLDNEKFKQNKLILEPSSGNGAIIKVLNQNGFDFVDHGDISNGYDFLEADIKKRYDYIITNPPFSLALEFIFQCKKIAKEKFALLLPITYLHGQTRLKKVWQDEEFSHARIHVFSRFPMLGDKLRDDGKYKTGMQVYAWYIWDKAHKGPATIHYIDCQKYILSAKDKS